jgi:hypothetical protein
MAAPLNTCTTIELRGVVRFLWAKNVDAAKDIHKEMLPIWAVGGVRHPQHTQTGSKYHLYTAVSRENAF